MGSREQFIYELRRRYVARLILRGNTWPRRAEIKELGGLWYTLASVWLMPTVASMRTLGAVKQDDCWKLPNVGGSS